MKTDNLGFQTMIDDDNLKGICPDKLLICWGRLCLAGPGIDKKKVKEINMGDVPVWLYDSLLLLWNLSTSTMILGDDE